MIFVLIIINSLWYPDKKKRGQHGSRPLVLEMSIVKSVALLQPSLVDQEACDAGDCEAFALVGLYTIVDDRHNRHQEEYRRKTEERYPGNDIDDGNHSKHHADNAHRDADQDHRC